MGDRTKWAVDFYLKRLQLDKFDKYCEWLHNNELPQADTFCPDCKTQIYDNNTLDIWLCYTCFRVFSKEEIIKLDPHSKDCEICGKKIMWHNEICEVCCSKQYKFGDFMRQKLNFIRNEVYQLNELICNYKWDFYQYKNKEEQLKQVRKVSRYYTRLEKIIKKIDIYFDEMKLDKKREDPKRWKMRCQNNIKYGIVILKKEKANKNGRN